MVYRKGLREWKILLLDQLKVILGGSAEGAYPILRDVLKGCSRLDAAVRITYLGIIDPATDCALVLLHDKLFLFVVKV